MFYQRERESKRTVLKIWQITGNPQTTYSITLDDFLKATTTFNCNILDEKTKKSELSHESYYWPHISKYCVQCTFSC
jgi:ribosomal 30S subunit maturation factor RimM